MSIDEALLHASWNSTVDASLLQPGLRVLIDVDPENRVAESNEADNTFPPDGAPVTLDVRSVAPVRVRLVPVIQAIRGDTGRVSDANKEQFVSPMSRMFPVSKVDADIREPYTYVGDELRAGGTNWLRLLSEINAVRVAEASGRIYYGVVRVDYTSGTAGLGYIGVPTAIGWDHQPSAAEVLAHEVGHNFGRLHAPCGGPSGVDDQYPYAGARIGVFGFDVVDGTLKLPVLRDLMSYCDPPWISDYTYRGIMNFRAVNPMGSAQPSGTPSRGLLIWGRIESGRLVLEPGFEVDAPAALPASNGPNLIEGFGPAGESLFSIAFSGDRVADSPDPGDETFAFVVPLSRLRGASLHRLRLSAAGRQLEYRGQGGRVAPASARRIAPGLVRLTWSAATSAGALIRDARTGRILSLARGGSVDLRTTSDEFDVTLSDGVASVRSRIRPR
jgi:hypothetical protein